MFDMQSEDNMVIVNASVECLTMTLGSHLFAVPPWNFDRKLNTLHYMIVNLD